MPKYMYLYHCNTNKNLNHRENCADCQVYQIYYKQKCVDKFYEYGTTNVDLFSKENLLCLHYFILPCAC